MMMLESLSQDFRFACHGLWRAKAFTGAAVLTLALGIAGTTVMFALIQGVLLRPLPVRDQDRLILSWKEVRTSGSARYPFGNTEIESVANASQLLEKAAGVTRNGVGRAVVTDNGVSSYANVALVTGGFFDVLGVQPILGRTLTLADDKDGAEHVLVLSSGLYGVMAAYVRQRDREIAVRLALGATATGVRRFVLAEAVRLAGLGAVIGLTGAAIATRLLRGMLFEVDPLDPFAIGGAALLLVAASALASYMPVRRATRVDAVAMLRSQ